jgi:putative MATE family efflux protein
MPVTMAIFSLLLGLAIGTSSVLSRKIGQGAHDEVVRITTHALALAGGIGIALALPGVALSDPLFGLMGAEDAMMPIIKSYIHTWFAGAVFLTLPLVGNAALRANGNAMVPAVVMTVASLVNLVLDPLMIFGVGPFPEMGVRGAALATVLANAGAMAAGLYVLGVRMKMLSLRPFHGALFGNSCRQLLMIGLPAGLTSMVQPVTNAVIISLLAGYGAETVAAFGIVNRVEAFAFIVVMGLAGGMAPIIGQNWGAGRYDRVNETLRKAFAFNVIWSLLVAAALGLRGHGIAALFSQERAVIDLAALYFLIVPVTYAVGNLVPGWASAFNAIGAPERAALMIFVKNLLVMIPAVAIGGHADGVRGIFIAVAVTNLCAGLALHVYSWRACRRWEHKTVAA